MQSNAGRPGTSTDRARRWSPRPLVAGDSRRNVRHESFPRSGCPLEYRGRQPAGAAGSSAPARSESFSVILASPTTYLPQPGPDLLIHAERNLREDHVVTRSDGIQRAPCVIGYADKLAHDEIGAAGEHARPRQRRIVVRTRQPTIPTSRSYCWASARCRIERIRRPEESPTPERSIRSRSSRPR